MSRITTNFTNFAKMKFMITGDLIRLIYEIGFYIIAIYSILSFIVGLIKVKMFLVMAGVLSFTVGNLVWRLFCEAPLIIFRIYEILSAINIRSGQIYNMLSKQTATITTNTTNEIK